MKLAHSVLAAAAFTVAGSALAAETAAVSAEAKAPLQTVLPNSYGSAELRHTLSERVDPTTGESNQVPSVSLRPTIGSTFFDSKLDTNFTWIFTKKAESAKIEKNSVGFYNETIYTAFQNDYVKLYPYLYAEQNNLGNNFGLAQVGPHADFNYAAKLSAGTLTFSGSLAPSVELFSPEYNSSKKVTVKNGTGRPDDQFSLTAVAEGQEPTTETEQKDPSFVNATSADVKFAPAALAGFSVAAGATYDQSWTPTYVGKDKEGDVVVEQDAYAVSSTVTNKLTLSYELNKTLTLVNQARYTVNGFYASNYENLDASRFENRLILSATLF